MHSGICEISWHTYDTEQTNIIHFWYSNYSIQLWQWGVFSGLFIWQCQLLFYFVVRIKRVFTVFIHGRSSIKYKSQWPLRVHKMQNICFLRIGFIIFFLSLMKSRHYLELFWKAYFEQISKLHHDFLSTVADVGKMTNTDLYNMWMA